MGVEIDFLDGILFVFVGCVSGFMNTVASSGTAITLPLMIFWGIDPIVANATNRLPVLVGFITSVFNFSKAGKIPWKTSLIFAIPIGIGTVLGSIFVGSLPSYITQILLSTALFISLILVILNPRRFLVSKNMGVKPINWQSMLIMFVIGIWAGIIVLDSALFVIFTLVLFMGYELIMANAIKSVLILVVGLVSIIVFIHMDEVDWRAGILLSLGSVAGSYIGSNFALQKNSRKWIFWIIKAIITIELILLIVKIIK